MTDSDQRNSPVKALLGFGVVTKSTITLVLVCVSTFVGQLFTIVTPANQIASFRFGRS